VVAESGRPSPRSSFNWASATGTSLLLTGGIVSGMLLGFTPANLMGFSGER
jgi:hypothetical protein